MKQVRLFGRDGTPTPEFYRRNIAKGEELKKRGMAVSAAKNAEYLAEARAVARTILHRDGTVDVARVRDELRGTGVVWGNWAGSIFKEAGWVPTGRWIKARHAKGHARMVREWTLS